MVKKAACGRKYFSADPLRGPWRPRVAPKGFMTVGRLPPNSILTRTPTRDQKAGVATLAAKLQELGVLAEEKLPKKTAKKAKLRLVGRAYFHKWVTV